VRALALTLLTHKNARHVRAFLIQITQINIQTSFKNGSKAFYRQNTIVMI